MKKLILIVGMSILLLVVAKAQDPAKVDPAHYKVLLNNEYVRIRKSVRSPATKVRCTRIPTMRFIG
jgi:hypothetical protein